RRGRANGLQGLRRLSAEEIREREPHIRGIAGLHVPETGIVDYVQVTQAYADKVRSGGGEVRLSSRLIGCRPQAGGLVLETASGEIVCRHLINCAGLRSDRVARLCGAEPGLAIVPFRGEYYELVPPRRSLVRNLV